MTHQLDQWSGEFGLQYTVRNRVDWRTREPHLRSIVEGLPIRRVLEVGCNRGHNLVALRQILGDEAELVGVEPGPYARQVATEAGLDVREASILDLPLDDGQFDLVFTAGVLIHIPLVDLARVMHEVYRCSRRYILAIEYFAEQETKITYRGQAGLLWKRNFLEHYRTRFPDLALLREGYLEDWDRTTWWLLEKAAPGGPNS